MWTWAALIGKPSSQSFTEAASSGSGIGRRKRKKKNLKKKTKLGNFCDQRGIGKGKKLQKKEEKGKNFEVNKKLLKVEVEQQKNHGKILILHISQNES